MKYQIKNVGQSRTYQYNGTQLISYAFQINDNGNDIWCDISQKPETPAPKVGDEIEGTITYSQNPQYNHKFKKDKKAFTGKSYGQSPEVRAEIIRQSSLAQAVAFSIARDPLTMTPESVIEIAKTFAKFAAGEEIKQNTTNPTPQPQTNATPQSSDNIDISEIPF